MTGTEFILHGDALGDGRWRKPSKALFLLESGELQELGVTPFGTVLRRTNTRTKARIYVNGLRVAEEDNFLFSYNITSPTAAMRRALNRERSNVGRTAYTNRAKAILLACDQDEVIDALVADLQNYERGTWHDETQWLDVGLHACKQLNARRKVIFLTAFGSQTRPTSCKEPSLTGTRSSSCQKQSARSCPACAMRSATRYATWTGTAASGKTASASHSSNRPTSATPNAQCGRHSRGSSRREGQTAAPQRRARLRDHAPDGRAATRRPSGLWESQDGRIIVKRTQLQSLANFAGTVLHELSHALSGAPDMSLEFEQQLTEELGGVAARSIR